ncbi:MAG: hypothetical protein K2Q09_06020 [Phycisphaerales bacterium]|nr:hypothetical protein [Phycisphaerales bacterium]
MTAMLYLWLLGLLLVAAGGMLIAQGWWLDKAAGNYKRSRCRKCWYELAATEPNSEGVTVCPECGTSARRPKDLHRVRRNGWLVLLGVALVAGGTYLSGARSLSNGNWLYLLPRWAAARLWKRVDAQQYGQQLKWRVVNGTATEAEVQSVAEGAKDLLVRALKARTGTMIQDIDTALAALSREQGGDPEVDAAAAAALVQGPWNGKSAVAYFQNRGVSMERRVELCEAAIAAGALTSPPNEYYEMLAGAKDDPAAMRGLVRAAASGGRWAPFVTHRLIDAGEKSLLAMADMYRASKDPKERAGLAKLFEDTFPFKGTSALTPFVLELCDDKADSAIGLQLLRFHSDKLSVPDDKLKEWILGEDTTRRDLALQQVGCTGPRNLPEGCGKVVIGMWDRDESLRCGVAEKFSGADRLLWLERAEKGRLGKRRDACVILAGMKPPLAEAEPLLRRIEADPAETEEMRVEARDALRRMGVWQK